MCGITGIVSKEKVDAQLLHEMTNILYHRGPDDGGSVILNDGKVGLGNRRLSIIDLSSAGHQPMGLDGKYWITYNGEVYNFQEIRHELESTGHRFRSQTDTEVILHAYQEWGEDCLHKFNGMFAIGIWDDVKKQLFLARDRLGIKPLYYTEVNGQFLFASEVKSFLTYPGFEKDIDHDSLSSILLLLWIPGPKTIFRNVLSVPSGCCAVYRDGRLTLKRYWDIQPQDGQNLQKHFEEELGARLETAVRRQMISDVPLGALLSGGIDSSAIVALMSKVSNQKVKTYTIAFRDADERQEAMPNDAEYARAVSKMFNTDHHEILLEPDVTDLLPRILWHLDKPIADPASINTYLISRAAREDGTVVLLSGMGGDEIFSGYRKHMATKAALYYRHLPSFLRKKCLEPLAACLPAAGRQRGYRLIRWLKRFAKNASGDSISTFLGNYVYFTPDELNESLLPDWRIDELNYAFLQHYEMFRRAAKFDYVNQMCYVDTKLFLPNLNLLYSDKATMAASVEGRVPLLDHELVTFAFQIPGNLKIRRLTQKYIFKRAMERYLPKEVIYRPKSPFGAPLRSWTRGQLLPMINDLYSESAVKRRGLFNYQSIRKMIDDNTSGREDYAHRLWALLTLEIWFQEFIDKDLQASAKRAHPQAMPMARLS